MKCAPPNLVAYLISRFTAGSGTAIVPSGVTFITLSATFIARAVSKPFARGRNNNKTLIFFKESSQYLYYSCSEVLLCFLLSKQLEIKELKEESFKNQNTTTLSS